MTSGARRVIFGIKLSEDEAAECDTARGDMPRSEWGRALLLAGAQHGASAEASAPVAAPSRKPRPPIASEPQCKHAHAIKGWCRECRTGGH